MLPNLHVFAEELTLALWFPDSYACTSEFACVHAFLMLCLDILVMLV
jgi:hypothetical protein